MKLQFSAVIVLALQNVSGHAQCFGALTCELPNMLANPKLDIAYNAYYTTQAVQRPVSFWFRGT